MLELSQQGTLAAAPAGPLPAPQYAFSRLVEHFQAMKESSTFQELADRWDDYLTAHQRVWNKCEAQYRTTSAWVPIRARFKQRRDSDRTLIYLQQARHADEHGIAANSQAGGGAIFIGGNGHIQELRIEAGRITKFVGDPTIKVGFSPRTVVAKPVVNRGVTYHPPPHPVYREGPPVLLLAEMGVRFYSDLMSELEVLAAAGT